MKKDYILLAFLAAISYFLQALAWPLASGRDGYSYLYYAFDFFNLKPEVAFTMLFRTPVAPFFDWALVSLLPAWGAELVMGFFFIAIILVLYRIGNFWSRRAGLIFAMLLLVHFGWGSLFHVISNDPPIAILAPLLLWSALSAVQSKTPWAFLLVGLLSGTLSLTRPGIFPVIGLLPFLLVRWPWRKRLASVVAFSIPCLLLLGGWGLWNLERHGVFAMAPGADVVLPLGRVLAQEQILREENGPNSKILADAVRTSLIPKEGKNVTADEYFLLHPHYFEYMVLADQTWGPGKYSVLKGAAWEAVRAYPGKYFGGVSKTILLSMAGNLKEPVPLRSGVRVHTHKGHVSFTSDGKDQWIPIANFDFTVPPRDDGIQAEMKKQGPNSLRAWNLMSSFPKRDGRIFVGTVLNWLAYLFPPMLLWILAVFLWPLGGFRLGEIDLALLLFCGLCLGTNILASFSIWSVVYEYRLPFDPIYVLAGLISIQRILQNYGKSKKIYS